METLIIHTENDEIKIIKDFLASIDVSFDLVTDKETPYNKAFIEKMDNSIIEAKEGNVKYIKTDDLWK